MILEQLVLHNFGAYRDRHVVELTPEDGRPVILIGGLNGGGKTSFLDALQLALYGRLSRTSNRGDLAYDEYLARSIHRGVSATVGAAVELQFSQTVAGVRHVYRIHRSWRAARSGTVREYVEVLRDGAPDPLLAESWDDHVEAFIPVRLAPLFFFDGEKIGALAEPESARDVLATALHALLGLDVVRRLELDLVSLERRHRAQTLGAAEQAALESARAGALAAQQARERALHEVGAARNAVDLARRELARAEEAYQAAGGPLYERRERLEFDRDQARRELEHVADEMRRLAAGPAPLLVVASLLHHVRNAATRAHEAARHAHVLDELERRDAALLEALASNKAAASVRRLIESTLREDRERRAPLAAAVPGAAALSDEDRRQVDALVGEILPSAAAAARHLLDAHRAAADAVELAERRLAGVPDNEAVGPPLQRRDEARAAVVATERAYETAEAVYAAAQRAADERERAVVREYETHAGAQLAAEDNQRLVSHAARVRATLEQFRAALVARRINQIRELILDSFQAIARKHDLVRDIAIDSDTYALALVGADGCAVPTEQLSAGERQILAVAILWGLARAAGRPLPAVIDTPLGRLDSVHREHLVRRYFPTASHQVILLSTDEEIDQPLYEALHDVVTRSYLLEFDETAGSTRVTPGYFWN